jgi:hypothetical protein
MSQAVKWADQEFSKHPTRDSQQKRLASEISFQALVADLPRPDSISERRWQEGARGHALLIERLQRVLSLQNTANVKL